MKSFITNLRPVLFCVVLAISLTSTHQINAQTVPALVNYQGRLANPDGTALATGDYQLTFRVYDSATNSGGLVWGPQIFDGGVGAGRGAKIPVVQGYFNVMLGPVDTNGVSLANAFTSSNRFVEITISNRPPILPRQQILSAPFALNSAKLSGADWSAVFGTNDPVNGRIPTTKLATNGTIIAQQIGVGTASPTFKLEVAVAANSFDGARILGSDNHWISLYPSINSGGNNLLEASGDAALIFSQGPPGTGNLVIGPYSGAAAGIKIMNDGKVGIGISAPSYKLDVQGVVHALDTNGGVAFFAETRNANAAAKFAVQHPGGVGFGNGLTLRNLDSTINNVTGIVGENAGGVAVAGMEFVNVNHLGVGSRRGALSLFTINSNTTSRIYMTPEGDLGIGTTTPARKLEVSGSIGASAYYGGVFYTGPTVGQTALGDGVIELGNSSTSGNTPFIDFHYGVGSIQDFNVRIINDANKTLDITAPGGNAILNVTGVVQANGFPLTSDRNAKTAFEALDLEDVLSRVVSLPITKWQFKVTSSERHIGPMAQDFKAAFGLGSDDKHIDVVDSVGVSLAAIQGLNQKLEEKLKAKDVEIEALKTKAAKIDLLEQRLNELERRAQPQSERH